MGYVNNGTIEEVMPSISEKMKDKIEVLNGEILFSGNEKEVKWAKELGINKIVKIEDGVLLSDNDNLSILSEDGTFTVPSSVSVVGEGAFSLLGDKVKKVIIPYTVKEIAQNAFRENTSIEEVKFQTREIDGKLQGTTKIGNNAFYGCTALNKLTLPDTLSEVEEDIFAGCRNLESIVIPESLTYVGTTMFNGCVNLQNVVLSEGVTVIRDSAFRGCSKLKNINFPSSLVTIGSRAFWEAGLNEAILNDSLLTIGEGVFMTCKNLTKVYIGPLVNKIGSNVFSGCNNLTSMEINNKNTNFKFSEGVLLNAKGTEMIYILPSTLPENKTEFTVPEGVTTLTGTMLSANFPQVKKLIIPASVTSIDTEYFLASITSLEVNANNKTYTVENNNLYSKNFETLYYYLENSATVNLNANVKTIKARAFLSASLTNVKEVYLTNGITNIEGPLFGGAVKSTLQKIHLGASVSDLSDSSLPFDIDVEIDPNNRSYLCENKVLYSYDKSKLIKCLTQNIDSFTIPDGVSIIGTGALSSMNIRKIKMSNDVTTIEYRAFYNDGQLKEIEWSNQLKTIGGQVFMLCHGLVDVEIPAGVDSIGVGCFGQCSSLKSVKIPNSVTTIGLECFGNCPKLTVEIDKKKGEIAGSPWSHVNGERGIKWLR